MNVFISLWQMTVILSAPLVLCALGGIISYQAGVVNIAMEGIMLSSCFVSVLVSYYSHSALLGLLAGMFTSILVSLFFSFFAVTLKANNFVIGIAINIFVSAVTLFLSRFLPVAIFNSPEIAAIPKLNADLKIEVLNKLFSGYSVLIYLAVILVFVIHYLLYKTPFGIRLRATGVFPDAVRTAGKNPERIRYLAGIITGVLSGLAGTQLSLSNVVLFSKDMTAGRGFIAFSAILIAGGKPKRAFLISVLFGFCDALATQLKSTGIPTNFLSIIPYGVALLTLILVNIRERRAAEERI